MQLETPRINRVSEWRLKVLIGLTRIDGSLRHAYSQLYVLWSLSSYSRHSLRPGDDIKIVKVIAYIIQTVVIVNKKNDRPLLFFAFFFPDFHLFQSISPFRLPNKSLSRLK